MAEVDVLRFTDTEGNVDLSVEPGDALEVEYVSPHSDATLAIQGVVTTIRPGSNTNMTLTNRDLNADYWINGTALRKIPRDEDNTIGRRIGKITTIRQAFDRSEATHPYGQST